MTIQVLSSRQYEAGYTVRDEIWTDDDNPDNMIHSEQAYTPEGLYIGDPAMAERLVEKLGIKPEKVKPDSGICTIGFSERDQLWYGWSHRAICGFGIGDPVEEGSILATELGVGYAPLTLDDCKRMAVIFAEDVG